MKKLWRYNPLSVLVRWLIKAELLAMLADIDYRIKLLDDGNRIGSHKLTLKHHILDGFSFTDNSPTAGNVAWSACHVVYQGTDYTITDGNTDLKYIWWDYDTTPTTFKTSNTKPTMTDDDCLICINDGGVHRLVIGQGRIQHGAFILGNSIGSGEMGAGSVTETVLASSAVTGTKISTGAIDNSNKFASGVVDSTALGSGSVTEAKIDTGAVTEGKIGSGAVTTAKIGNSQVTGDKAATGAFNSTKLNLLAHLLY